MTKQKTGISRLLNAMKKNIREVNDQEICRRLEILMYSEKEDLNSQIVKRILESDHFDLEPREIPEAYTQYVKHYFYMLKREKRIREKEGTDPSIEVQSAVMKGSSVKKKTPSKKKTKKSVKSNSKKTTGKKASKKSAVKTPVSAVKSKKKTSKKKAASRPQPSKKKGKAKKGRV